MGGLYRDSAGEKTNILYSCICHHIYKHIPISFDVMITWNQEVFLCVCVYMYIYAEKFVDKL